MALQTMVQEKLNLEHKWARLATTGQQDEMKVASFQIKDLKKQIENRVEQEQNPSIVT